MPNWKQTFFGLAPLPIKEWLVAAEALRLNSYRRYGDVEAVRREYAFAHYAAMTQDELRVKQLQCLQELASYARAHCTYYRERLPTRLDSLDDLRHIPLLRKADVRANFDAILADAGARSRILLDQTSGTTGSFMRFAASAEGVRAHFAVIDNYYASFGCDYGARRVRLGGHVFAPASRTRPPFWLYSRVDNQLYMSAYHMDAHTLPLYVAKLNAFRPVYITGLGHITYLLGHYLEEHGGLAFTPRGVFTDAEMLLPQQRETIERGFGVDCYDIYGTRETNWLAAQCVQHRYHTLPLSSILEVVDDAGRPLPAGQVGHIVVTDLTQKAFPFIRYDTGDLGALAAEECPCGWHSRVLDLIEGRTDDYILTPRGRKVIPLARVIWAAQHVIESQVVQTHPDRVLLRVVPETGFVPEDMRLAVVKAHELLGDEMRVDWEAVPAIPRQGTKFKWIVRAC
jgi:phenylacetate-CoA ligase